MYCWSVVSEQDWKCCFFHVLLTWRDSEHAVTIWSGDSVTFWMLKSNNITTKFAPTQSAVLSELRHKNHCSFWKNLFEMAKYLVRVVAFSILQKHLHRERFMQWCMMIIVRESISSKTSQVCQTAFGTCLYHNQQFTHGTRHFILGKCHLKSVTILWPSTDHCYQTKCGQCEGSDQRKPTSCTKWDQAKRQFQSFIGKLGSDPPL